MQPTSLSIRRILLTDKVALMMRDMGYDVVLPEAFGTFHSVLDTATGLLTIQGGNDNTLINNVDQGASSDTISLLRFGNFLVVGIDVGVDVPGSGPGMTPQDQQDAFISFFNVADVSSAGASVVAETGDDSLDGGSGADTLFGDSWALGAPLDFGVQGGNDTMHGGSGNDLAVGQTGNDLITGGGDNDTLLGADGDDLIRGGGGNDQLSGGTGHDILLGEVGNDALTGGDGRDVLIGGLGADTLDGGADDDILIAGTTAHDNNDMALTLILDEWTSPRTYQKRVNNLKGIGNGPDFVNRLNGMVFLIKNNGNGNGPAATVFDDVDNDALTGSTGVDWFFSDNLDDLLDRVGGETKN